MASRGGRRRPGRSPACRGAAVSAPASSPGARHHEGVLYAKKDYNLAKHPPIDALNLEVIKLMQSFKSKEYVRETFSWQHYYWYLANDDIEFLRTFLNLSSEIVPNTLKKSAKPPSRPFGSGPPDDRPR
ncbi:hypothetical protein TRIUR3_19705 [Triticum urartu]|uniref:Plectin/eS10 N-terminal domain-containing protein n=1 Tax=Triticum urartu TaxID=4572 RepID=M8AYB3_TRIUA|nr:hypothetical protein TRIUR3_19705 [Triticum urartu]